MKYDVVIIGGVAAGTSAGASAKRVDSSLGILLIQKEKFISYGGCGLPYYVQGIVKDIDDLIEFTPQEFREKKGVEVLPEHEVFEVDFEKKIVKVRSVKDGDVKEFEYEKLVVTTGASPIVPNLEGIEDERIFTVRTPEDAMRIRGFIEGKKPESVAIVGGGYIGVEMSEAFRTHGLKVFLIEMMDHLLGNAEPEINEVVVNTLERNGVKVLLKTQVRKFVPDEKIKVVTNSGDMEVDMVLISVGVKPNTEIFDNVKKGVKGAIEVDETGKTSMEDVFSAGDCATVDHFITKEKVYIPMGTTANKQGRIVGRNVAGRKERFIGVLGSSITKIFDVEFGRTGLTEEEARRFGYDSGSVYIKSLSKAKYYPGSGPIHIKLSFDKKTGKILGAQMVGSDVHKRIDVMTSAIYGGLTVEELGYMDLAYAPPFSPVWDPVLISGNVARRYLKFDTR